MLNNCCAPAHSASSLPLKLHPLPNLPYHIQSTFTTRGLLFEDFVLESNGGGKTRAPEGMTFPHCHQLYQGLIKYRLCAILVLTYLMAYSMERVRGDHGQNLRGGGVGHDEMKEITQRVTLMGQAWPAPRMTEQTNKRTNDWMDRLISTGLFDRFKSNQGSKMHWLQWYSLA